MRVLALEEDAEYFEPSPIPTHHARPFGCEVLETVKIRSPGLVQGYNFAVDNSVCGKRSWSASAICGKRLLKFLPFREYRMVSRLDLTPMAR